MKYEVRNTLTGCLRRIAKAAVGLSAERLAGRNGPRELRTYELTVLPGEGGFSAGAARSENASAFVFGGEGGHIGLIRVNAPLWTLEKQMIGKRCGPFCDIMGIDALCVSCAGKPGTSDIRTKKQVKNFFASPLCDECTGLLKQAWDSRRGGASPAESGLRGISPSPDLRIVFSGGSAGKIICRCRESFERVTDIKTLYYIIRKRIPARLRPSESGAGVITMTSELCLTADSNT